MKTSHRSSKVVLALLVVTAVGAGIAACRLPGFSERCPVAALAASAPQPPQAPVALRAEGRLVAYPGAEALVGAERGGRIVRVAVKEGDRVERGQLLVEIDGSEERAALSEARARVAEADADIRLAEGEVARLSRLRDAGVATQQLLDRALRDRDAARAHRATATATVERLSAALAKTRIVAPLDGVVVRRSVEPGETVAPGAPLARIADLGRLRVEAEVDEYDAGRVRLGGAATVTAEGYDGAWQGKVEEVPDALEARRLRPSDPGRPSDTRVLLVKVALAERTPLKLGQRVEVALAFAGGGA